MFDEDEGQVPEDESVRRRNRLLESLVAQQMGSGGLGGAASGIGGALGMILAKQTKNPVLSMGGFGGLGDMMG